MFAIYRINIRNLEMPKIKLDHTFCLTAQCEPGRRKTDYWDVIVSGFVLEARSSGGKTYYLRYFDAAGRQRQHKIGGHGEITFDQAKKAAQRLRSEVVLGAARPKLRPRRKRSRLTLSWPNSTSRTPRPIRSGRRIPKR